MIRDRELTRRPARLVLASMLIVSFASNAVAQSTPNDTRSAEFHAVTTAVATERLMLDLAEGRGGGYRSTTLDSQEPNPLPEHTGFTTLAKDTVSDFVALPNASPRGSFLLAGLVRRWSRTRQTPTSPSTSLAAKAPLEFFKLGKIVGSAGFQTGTALSLWLIGRYIVPKNEDGSRSNKASHLALDLLRAQIVSQAMVHAIKYTVRRTGLQVSAARSRQGTRRLRFRLPPSSSGTSENAAAGGRSRRPVTSRPHGLSTTAISSAMSSSGRHWARRSAGTSLGAWARSLRAPSVPDEGRRIDRDHQQFSGAH